MFERYILNRGGPQYWHQQLIQYFQTEANSLRRCEELPWHLQRCFQWDALRDVLVNLPMFQLLYTANFKAELFGYWKVLTDGPLLCYNADGDAGDAPTHVAPFDVVREYSKSVEDWYRITRPPTKTFTPMLLQVPICY